MNQSEEIILITDASHVADLAHKSMEKLVDILYLVLGQTRKELRLKLLCVQCAIRTNQKKNIFVLTRKKSTAATNYVIVATVARWNVAKIFNRICKKVVAHKT